MSDLVKFLAAQWDEDEFVAQGAARTDDGHLGTWSPMHFGAGGFDARVDDHIARHDPARVLREVAAKRAILADYVETAKIVGAAEAEQERISVTARDYLDAKRELAVLLPVICHLAAVHSDEPDYDPEWDPDF
jgi:hypothetical protein